MIDYIEIIKQIYAAEIAVRISWTWDSGFHWFLLDGKKDSRLALDLSFIGDINPDTGIQDVFAFGPDWIDNGVKDTFQGMILDLSKSITQHFPKSPFTTWYKEVILSADED